MIKTIHLKLLRNAEYLQFIRLLLNRVGENDPNALQIINQFNALKREHDEADALFKLPLANELSGDLLELDVQRDRAIIGISFVVKGYLNHFDAKKADAAERLDNNLNLYGSSISRLNYQAESTTLTSIVRDWTFDAKLSADCKLLDLGDWIKEMNLRNKDFDQLYNKRIDQYIEDASESLYNKRSKVNTAYHELNAVIEAHYTITKSAGIKKIIDGINMLIDQYNTLLATRKPEKKEDKKKDEGETPTEE